MVVRVPSALAAAINAGSMVGTAAEAWVAGAAVAAGACVAGAAVAAGACVTGAAVGVAAVPQAEIEGGHDNKYCERLEHKLFGTHVFFLFSFEEQFCGYRKSFMVRFFRAPPFFRTSTCWEPLV